LFRNDGEEEETDLRNGKGYLLAEGRLRGNHVPHRIHTSVPIVP